MIAINGLSGANIGLTNNDQGYEVVRVVGTDGNRLSLSEAEYIVGNRSNLSRINSYQREHYQ